MVDPAAGSSATAGRSQRAGGPGWSHRSGGHRVVGPGESGSRWAARTLAGTNPLSASAGQVTRHRLNRSGDHQLNAALHTIALTWLSYDPETRAYAARRTTQGKTHRDVKWCLKRSIARQLVKLFERYDQPGMEIIRAA